MLLFLKRLLSRPNVVVWFMFFFVCFCLIGVIVPQTSFRSPGYFKLLASTYPVLFSLIDKLQLNRIFSSILFILFMFPVYIALAITLWLQLKRQLRTSYGITRKTAYELGGQENIFPVKYVSAVTIQDKITSVMVKRHFTPCSKMTDQSSNTLIYTKYQKSRWGSFVFHLGLFVLLNTAIYALFFYQRGFVQLIEGETFIGRDANWLVPSNGLLPGNLTFPFNLRLNKFRGHYWDNDQEKQLNSQVLFIDQSEKHPLEREISVSSPIEYGGVTFYQSQDFGYALTFAMDTGDGNPIVTHFTLNAVGDKHKPLTGKSDFPESNFIFKLKFHPDIYHPSFFLKQPGVELTILKGNIIQYEGRLLLGQTVQFGNNVLTFLDVRSWSGIIAIRGYALPLVYCSFFLVISGILLIYIFPFQQIYIRFFKDDTDYHIMIKGRIGQRTAYNNFELQQIEKEIRDTVVLTEKYSATI